MNEYILDNLIGNLNTDEQIFKQAYENGGADLLDTPMTFAQYKEYVRDGRCATTEASKKYIDFSQEQLGNTIISVEDIFNEEIFVGLHQRYSYPILHNHTYIEIIYVYSGTCVHFVGDKKHVLQTGDVCILAPDTMHTPSVADDDTIVVNIMVSRQVFGKSFLDLLRGGKIIAGFFENLFYKQNRISPYIIYPTGTDRKIRQLANWMYEEICEQEYAFGKNLLYLVQSLFLHLIRKYEMLTIVSDPVENRFNNHVVSVLGYLSVNYNRTTLAQTAAFFGYTPNYLGTMIKQYTGNTYSSIIQAYQMEHAKRLLDEGKLSITEIGEEVGCFDTSHFIRKFKKAYDISPSQYRNEKQK